MPDDARARATHDAHPWPREIPALGRLRILPLAKCEDCDEHTWAVYGQVPLCRTHARTRAAVVLDGKELEW